MDDLDRAILEAWSKRSGNRCSRGGRGREALRSWAPAIRAGDRRWIPGRPVDSEKGARNLFGEVIDLDGVEARAMCRPIRIDPPGLSIASAAERFGVGINTIRRWEKRGIVAIDRDPVYPRRRPRWNVCWVTTRGEVDPGGEVWSMPWGAVRRMLVDAIPEAWSQSLVRVRRAIGAQGGQWQWCCPCCGAMAFKLYWPMPHVTVPRWMAQMAGGGHHTVSTKPRNVRTSGQRDRQSTLCPAGQSVAPQISGFSCRRCAGLVYESAERTSHKDGRAVDVWDRFIGRIGAGRLRGRDVCRYNASRSIPV